MSHSPTLLKLEIHRHRATLTLNDPETRNAMSEAMGEQFVQVIREIQADKSIRVLVLTGAGKAFSGGGHLEMLEAKTRISQDENEALMKGFYANFLSLTDVGVPVLAAINGHAVGAGLCLAMACDIRIASTEAKLGLNFVNLGLHPGMGATFSLPRLVGPAKAAELLYTGAIISAEEGQRIGLVNRAVPPESFLQVVDEMAGQIAAAGPQAVRELKASLRMLSSSNLEECLAREAKCQGADYVGTEFAEGIKAAREKRKPQF